MDRKVTTISTVEEAKKFDVATAWNETVKEIESVGAQVPQSTKDHGFLTEARTTLGCPAFSLPYMVQGYSYIVYVWLRAPPQALPTQKNPRFDLLEL